MDSIKTTVFPEATRRVIQAILQQHGASLEVFSQEERPYCLMRLPEGTKRERTERLAYHQRYHLTLPDGFEFFQTTDQEGWSTISTIRFSISDQEERA